MPYTPSSIDRLLLLYFVFYSRSSCQRLLSPPSSGQSLPSSCQGLLFYFFPPRYSIFYPLFSLCQPATSFSSLFRSMSTLFLTRSCLLPFKVKTTPHLFSVFCVLFFPLYSFLLPPKVFRPSLPPSFDRGLLFRRLPAETFSSPSSDRSRYSLLLQSRLSLSPFVQDPLFRPIPHLLHCTGPKQTFIKASFFLDVKALSPWSHLSRTGLTYIAVHTKHILSGGEFTSLADNLHLTGMYLQRTSPNTNAFGG